MNNIATYVRIFNMHPDDDYVAKRGRATARIYEAFAALTPTSRALEMASYIAESLSAGGNLPNSLADIASAALAHESEAFVRQDQEMQMLICSMVAARDLVSKDRKTDGWTSADALAAGLWSALSFQPTYNANSLVEDLRVSLLVTSRNRVTEIAVKARQRAEVPEIGRLSIPESAPTGARAQTAFREAARPLVAALRNNAELDREEIEFLWWVLADHCDSLDRPMAELENATRAVAAGLDGAAKLRKLPADGHRNVVLRSIQQSENLSLGELLKLLSTDREILAANYNDALINSAPAVFPLVAALSSGSSGISGADTRRSPREWGARALLEAGILAVDGRKPYL